MTTVAEARSFGAVRAKPALGHRLRRRSLPYLLLAPSLILLAAFTYAPILRVAWDSLHDEGHATGKSAFVGLGNYIALFSDKAFGQSVVNNLIYAAGTVPISMALALLFAMALQRSTRFNAVVREKVIDPRRAATPSPHLIENLRRAAQYDRPQPAKRIGVDAARQTSLTRERRRYRGAPCAAINEGDP